MEITDKKLKIPAASVHDVRYLYTVIAGLKKKGEAENSGKTIEYFRKLVNAYNESKATSFGLSYKSREVNADVVRDAVTELSALGMISTEKDRLSLTSLGERVASLIESRDSRRLRQLFAKSMLDSYEIFAFFLKRTKLISRGDGVPIPEITSEIFDKFKGDPQAIGRGYVDVISSSTHVAFNLAELDRSLSNPEIAKIEKRTERVGRVQSIIEKFVVSSLFAGNITSRRAYDFVRSRTTYLELTNYSVVDLKGYPVESTYMVSDFEPSFKGHSESVDYTDGRLYLHLPFYEEIHDDFKASIAKGYQIEKDEFGYARVADVRDSVCRDLRISDDLFDDYVKRLYQEEPHWLSFTYSGAADRITEKRLPVILERPTREFFTLIKVNS